MTARTDIRRFVVHAGSDEHASQRALEEGAAIYTDLLVAGVESIEDQGDGQYLVTVNTRPRPKRKRSSPPVTTAKQTLGPREGLDHLEWAAADLGIEAHEPCSRCDGTGTLPAKNLRNPIARALTGKEARGVGFARLIEDPPLSLVKKVARRLDVDLDTAAKWLGQLHKAETAAKNGAGK